MSLFSVLRQTGDIGAFFVFFFVFVVHVDCIFCNWASLCGVAIFDLVK